MLPRAVGLPRTASCASAARRQIPGPSFARRAASTAPGSTSSGSGWLWGGLAALAAGAGGYYALSNSSEHKPTTVDEAVKSQHKLHKDEPIPANAPAGPKKVDYQAVYNDIAELLDAEDYDDGSYGPVLVRLAWHCSGTYDKHSGNGGSNGATMRFAPEASHGANAGLVVARDLLEKLKQKYGDDITYSDLWTLAGVCAIQEMGGPTINWRPGRQDGLVENCTPDGRLPDGDKGSDHLRNIFYRQGFNDQEIVALSGAHALGRCHTDRSGFDGPWGFSPTAFTNDYFQKLLEEKWNLRKWDGPPQYQDQATKSLMMLLTDMALTQDKAFRPWVEKYAADENLFFNDFSKVFAKLIENGVPTENFKSTPMTLKKTEDQ